MEAKRGCRVEAGDDAPVLPEVLRQLERLIDRQGRALEEQDDRTEQALTLSVAILGGALALASLVRSSAALDGAFLALLGVSAVLNIAALAAFLRAYLALPKAVAVGPDPHWMSGKANDVEWKLADLLLSVVTDYPDYYVANGAILRRAAREQLRGATLLVGSLGGYAMATFYILGRGVWW